MASARARFEGNPFYVLGLRPTATRAELEREGQKWLGMLELGLSSASTYATPLGRVERTADKVRQAMAELRDPAKRLVHELWARLDPNPPDPDADLDLPTPPVIEPAAGPWPQALGALGFSPRGKP